MADYISKISSKIKSIQRDKCILPTKMSAELTEEIGIHLGDGSIDYRNQEKRKSYEFRIISNLDELDYSNNYVIADLVF